MLRIRPLVWHVAFGDGASVERLLLTLIVNVIWSPSFYGGRCARDRCGCIEDHPLSMDEYAAVFQAKVFAAGAMHGLFPPELLDNLIPHGFQNQFLMVNRETGAVVSAYWPGFSLLLTPFVWLGIPWACNPTLVVASFLLIGRIARDLVTLPLAAGWALLFALASPAFVANGITYYSMSAHLLFNLGFAWLLLVPSPKRIFLAGLVGGFALILHNPFPHAAFASALDILAGNAAWPTFEKFEFSRSRLPADVFSSWGRLVGLATGDLVWSDADGQRGGGGGY